MEEATYFELKPVNYFFTMMTSADQSDPPQYPRIITDEEAFSFPPNKRSICFFPVQIPRPPDCSLYQIDPNLSRIGNEDQLSAPSVYYTPYEHLGVTDGNLQDSGLVEVEISRRSNNASFESQQNFFDRPIDLTPPPFQVDQNPNEERMPAPTVSSALNSPIEANNENRQQADSIEGSAQLKKKSTSRRSRERRHSKPRPKCSRRRILKGIRRNADSYDVAHDHCYVFWPTDPALAVFSHRRTRPASSAYSEPEERRNLSLSPSRSEKSIASTHRRHRSAESIDSVEVETEKNYRYRGRLRENEIPPRTIRTRTDKRKESKCSVDSSDLPKDSKDIEIDSSFQKTQINNPEPLGRCLRSRMIKTEEPIALNLRSRSRKMQKEENSFDSKPSKEEKKEETPLNRIIVPKEKRDRNPKSRSRSHKKGKTNRSRKPQKEQKDLEIKIVESSPEGEDHDSDLIIDEDSTDLTGQLNQNSFFHSAQKRRSHSQSEENKTKKKKPNKKMNLEEIHLISSVIVNNLAIGSSSLQISSFCEEIIRDELAIPVKEKPKEKKIALRFGIDAILGITDKEDDEKIRESFEAATLNSEPQCTPSTEVIFISDTEEASVNSEKAWLEQKKNEITSNAKRNSTVSISIFGEESSNNFWNTGAKKLKIPLPIVDSTAQDKSLDEIQRVNSHRLRSTTKETKEENSQLVESSKFVGDQELYLVQMNALAAITENLRLQGKVTSKLQKMCAKAANTLQEFGKNL